MISAGFTHTCAVTSSQQAFCWGAHDGLLPENTFSANVATHVTSLGSGVLAISAGEGYSCAIVDGRGAVCWGENKEGKLGTGSTADSLVPTAVVGLKSGITSIATGKQHTCALSQQGKVMCWGEGTLGRLGTGNNDDTTVPQLVKNLDLGAKAIAVGGSRSCAITNSGGLECWGWHAEITGNSIASTPLAMYGLDSDVMAVSCGANHTCALTTVGRVLCWGSNEHGQLGDTTNTERSLPTQVVGLESGVTSISAGYYHTCALMSSGGVKCWGHNNRGQLGDGSTTHKTVPTPVLGIDPSVTAISAGYEHTCAIGASGEGWCWGSNSVGELGNGTRTDSATPVRVIGFR